MDFLRVSPAQRQIAERLVFTVKRDPPTTSPTVPALMQSWIACSIRPGVIPGCSAPCSISTSTTQDNQRHFGHRAGDSVLIRTADTVSKPVRNNEIFACPVATSFAIIAPNADQAGAQAWPNACSAPSPACVSISITDGLV
ncbi:MAG: diguanylate cyclase [Dechloromonas sp.]|uniref:Diguanylate cyclase n=1 Tax=Candidatus Dechloromonas phosphorivorans TaxID=2899244 RepID=A0A935JYE5_9RHOO|nr:diguanylate cyclase [Candidatus Dechloromonas phosphorivorans]